MLPPVPTWEGLHPIVVHFPIALLLIAPLLVVGVVVFEKHARVLSVIALCLMLVGTAFAFVARESGEAAEHQADIPTAAASTLERHEELADLTVKVFFALVAIYIAICLASIFFGKVLPRPVRVVVNLAFLMLYIGGGAMLAQTAHAGGTLVHHFGVRNAQAAPLDAGSNLALMDARGHKHDTD